MFVITKKNNTRPLSFFHPNTNCLGGLSETIGFSSLNYFIYHSKDEAQEHIDYMKKKYNEIDRFSSPEQYKNLKKLDRILNSLEIKQK